MKLYTTLKIYKAEVENQLERKIKRVRSDRGGEYFSNLFTLFCEEYGIIYERTPPYSPQSNGVAERKNRTLTDLVNAMLDTAGSGGIRIELNPGPSFKYSCDKNQTSTNS